MQKNKLSHYQMPFGCFFFNEGKSVASYRCNSVICPGFYFAWSDFSILFELFFGSYHPVMIPGWGSNENFITWTKFAKPFANIFGRWSKIKGRRHPQSFLVSHALQIQCCIPDLAVMSPSKHTSIYCG